MKIEGLKKPDEFWVKMKAIWDACKDANITAPMAVRDFFGEKEPDPKGDTVDLVGSACVTRVCEGISKGFEVEVSEIPQGVKVLRFLA